MEKTADLALDLNDAQFTQERLAQIHNAAKTVSEIYRIEIKDYNDMTSIKKLILHQDRCNSFQDIRKKKRYALHVSRRTQEVQDTA